MDEKETTFAKNYYSTSFQYLKSGKYPNKLLESFTGKTVRKLRKRILEEKLKRKRNIE